MRASHFRIRRIPKIEATVILDARQVEARQTPELRRTRFGIVNAITRAGQQFANPQWVQYDELAGRLLRLGPEQWRDLTARASRLKRQDVESRFASAV